METPPYRRDCMSRRSLYRWSMRHSRIATVSIFIGIAKADSYGWPKLRLLRKYAQLSATGKQWSGEKGSQISAVLWNQLSPVLPGSSAHEEPQEHHMRPHNWWWRQPFWPCLSNDQSEPLSSASAAWHRQVRMGHALKNSARWYTDICCTQRYLWKKPLLLLCSAFHAYVCKDFSRSLIFTGAFPLPHRSFDTQQAKPTFCHPSFSATFAALHIFISGVLKAIPRGYHCVPWIYTIGIH